MIVERISRRQRLPGLAALIGEIQRRRSRRQDRAVTNQRLSVIVVIDRRLLESAILAHRHRLNRSDNSAKNSMGAHPGWLAK